MYTNIEICVCALQIFNMCSTKLQTRPNDDDNERPHKAL